MTSTSDSAEIEAVFQKLREAHAARDADSIIEAFAPDAIIYDLAPPLGHSGLDRSDVAAWLATWDGPIRMDARDTSATIDGDLAIVSGLNRMQGRQGGKDQDIWYRRTTGLRNVDRKWQIVSDHTSVPFYMDGSYRAAVDLQPT